MNFNPIRIDTIRYFPIAIPYKIPFRTSYGEETYKVAVIIQVVTSDGVTGWGEASVERAPLYGTETVTTALHMLEIFLNPSVRGRQIDDPRQTPELYRKFQGHPAVKCGLEAAVWDAFAKANQRSLSDLFHHYVNETQSRTDVNVGVVVGIQKALTHTLELIEQRQNEGYRSIKLKWSRDLSPESLRTIRTSFPQLKLMIDANGSFSPDDMALLEEVDGCNLLLIEQPFTRTDFVHHQILAAAIQTPLCLDESIDSFDSAILAHKLNAMQIINIKPARVGGFTEALKIYQFARQHNIGLRIGGMLETGIGRTSILQLATLSALNYPSDISATSRYFEHDLTAFIELNNDGSLSAPDGWGIGMEVDEEVMLWMTELWTT